MAYLRAYQAKGDPGIFGFLGKGLRKLAGAVVPSIPGVGPIARVAGGIVGKGGKALGKFPGGAKGALIAGGAAAAAGAAGMAGEAMMAGGHRRYRRMNVGNTKALRRSMRRVQGFAKLARQTITFTHTHKLKRHRRK